MESFVNRLGWILAGVVSLLVLAAVAGIVRAGPLDPPGSPGSSMKTLDQVEPRIPIDHIPFAINSAGSYYLTQNVTGPANPGMGITINTDDVTLDLSGFTIMGTGATGAGGTGYGIYLPWSPTNNVTIRNGVITGWNYGIVADNARYGWFENLHAANNLKDGIRAGAATVISDCVASANGNVGVASFGGSVENCTVVDNVWHGIEITGRSLVRANRVTTTATGADFRGGIHVLGEKNVVQDNYVHMVNSGTEADIFIDGSSNWVMRNNVSSIDDNGSSNAVGQKVYSGDFATNTNPTTNYSP